MRPIPSKKHHWAVLVILAIVAINTLVTFGREDVTGEQINMLAEVFKARDPTLYASDGLFAPTGEGAAWRLHLPAWRRILSLAMDTAGPAGPLHALRIVAAASLLMYLLAMYVLLYRQTHSTSVAVLTAALSMVIFSSARPYWGLGPLFAVTPASLYLAAVPLLALGFVRVHARWSVLLVFLIAGLCGNIHLNSAINLVIVMLVALIGLGRFRPRSLARAGACLAAAAVGAAPAIYYCYVTFRQAGPIFPPMGWRSVREALAHAGMNVLYPEILIEALRWLPVACVLAIPAAIILARAGRYCPHNLGGWIWLLAAAIFTAFGLHGLVQLVGWLTQRPVVLIELFGALRLAMLPLYVLFAQALVHMLRMAKAHRGWVRAGVGLFAAVFIGSGYNTLPIRHMALDLVADIADQESPGRLNTRQAKNAELRHIGSWARIYTNKDALFITDRAEIRLYGRRSITACPADLSYLLHLAPQRIGQWDGLLRRQQRLLAPYQSAKAKAGRIIAFAEANSLPGIETYVVIPAESAPSPGGRLKEIAPLNNGWGRYWRLFRILPPPVDIFVSAAFPEAYPARQYGPDLTGTPLRAYSAPAWHSGKRKDES